MADTFCAEYPINQDVASRGEPGMLFGRYPGDVYMGGNPWQLLTAVTAELFYKGADINARKVVEAQRDIELSADEHPKWKGLLKLPEEGTTLAALAQAQVRTNNCSLRKCSIHSFCTILK